MLRPLFTYFCLSVCLLCHAQDRPFGLWKIVDDQDGLAKSLIEIYEENGKLYGKVIQLLDDATVRHCQKCPGELKNKPLENLVILADLTLQGDSWEGGSILDPASGKTYKCLLELVDENVLKVRGYLGLPLFGRTQYWYRIES